MITVTATATAGEAAMGTTQEAIVLARGLREHAFAGIDSSHRTVI